MTSPYIDQTNPRRPNRVLRWIRSWRQPKPRREWFLVDSGERR